MFSKIFKKKPDEVSKRSMRDVELRHLTEKIKTNLSIIKSLKSVEEMRYYFNEISGWINEIHNDDFKGFY